MICSVLRCGREAFVVYEGYSLCRDCLADAYRIKRTRNTAEWFRYLTDPFLSKDNEEVHVPTGGGQ